MKALTWLAFMTAYGICLILLLTYGPNLAVEKGHSWLGWLLTGLLTAGFLTSLKQFLTATRNNE